MSVWMYRVVIGVAVGIAIIFAGAFLLALNLTSREAVTAVVGGDAPQESMSSETATAAPIAPTGTHDLVAHFQTLANEALRTRKATIMGEALLHQEAGRLRGAGKWAEAAELEATEDRNSKIRDQADGAATEAILALEKAMISDMRRVEQASQRFVITSNDTLNNTMVFEIIEYGKKHHANLSNPQSGFQSESISAWSRSAYADM